MKQLHFTIYGTMKNLNDYIAAMNLSRYAGNSMKKQEQGRVISALPSHYPAFDRPVKIRLEYFEQARRRDPDNIMTSKKWILDGLVEAGVLLGDGWRDLSMPVPFFERFYIDKENPRIEVTIYDEEEE